MMHVICMFSVSLKFAISKDAQIEFSVKFIDSRSSRSLEINHTLNTNVHNNRPDTT